MYLCPPKQEDRSHQHSHVRTTGRALVKRYGDPGAVTRLEDYTGIITGRVNRAFVVGHNEVPGNSFGELKAGG